MVDGRGRGRDGSGVCHNDMIPVDGLSVVALGMLSAVPLVRILLIVGLAGWKGINGRKEGLSANTTTTAVNGAFILMV